MELRAKYILGEKRRIWFSITSRKGESFLISESTWKLSRIGTDDTQLSGTCDIDNANHDIALIIQPEKRGNYNLDVTYKIAEEIFIERIRVEVV